MVFKGPAGFQRVIYVLMNLILGIIISICLTAIVLKAPLTVAGIVTSTILSFFVGYGIADLVPAMTWGKMLEAKVGAKGLAGHLVSSAVLAVVMGTFILFFCSIVNVLAAGGVIGVLGFFAGAYPIVIAIAYLCVVICLPLCVKAAVAISGFDPENPKG